jgi:hypothetical protein
MVSHTQQNSSSRIDKTQVREMRHVGDGEREKFIIWSVNDSGRRVKGERRIHSKGEK